MNRLLKAAAALLCAVGLTASASTVTAVVIDTDGQTWNNGTYTATLTLPGTVFLAHGPTIGGVPVVPSIVKGSLSSTGVLSGTFVDTSTVDQPNAQWSFVVCPNTSGSDVCLTVTTTVVGATVDLSAAFSQMSAPRFPTGARAYGYLDKEVQLPPPAGSVYFNMTDQCQHQWNGTVWTTCQSGGGGGGVTPGGATYELQAKPSSGTTLLGTGLFTNAEKTQLRTPLPFTAKAVNSIKNSDSYGSIAAAQASCTPGNCTIAQPAGSTDGTQVTMPAVPSNTDSTLLTSVGQNAVAEFGTDPQPTSFSSFTQQALFSRGVAYTKDNPAPGQGGQQSNSTEVNMFLAPGYDLGQSGCPLNCPPAGYTGSQPWASYTQNPVIDYFASAGIKTPHNDTVFFNSAGDAIRAYDYVIYEGGQDRPSDEGGAGEYIAHVGTAFDWEGTVTSLPDPFHTLANNTSSNGTQGDLRWVVDLTNPVIDYQPMANIFAPGDSYSPYPTYGVVKFDPATTPLPVSYAIGTVISNCAVPIQTGSVASTTCTVHSTTGAFTVSGAVSGDKGLFCAAANQYAEYIYGGQITAATARDGSGNQVITVLTHDSVPATGGGGQASIAAQGGACGTVVNLTSDTYFDEFKNNHVLGSAFPVFVSPDAHTVGYMNYIASAPFWAAIPHNGSAAKTEAQAQGLGNGVNGGAFTVTNLVRSTTNGVTTLTGNIDSFGNPPIVDMFVNQFKNVIAGCADSTMNGVYPNGLFIPSPKTFSMVTSGANSTCPNATISLDSKYMLASVYWAQKVYDVQNHTPGVLPIQNLNSGNFSGSYQPNFRVGDTLDMPPHPDAQITGERIYMNELQPQTSGPQSAEYFMQGTSAFDGSAIILHNNPLQRNQVSGFGGVQVLGSGISMLDSAFSTGVGMQYQPMHRGCMICSGGTDYDGNNLGLANFTIAGTNNGQDGLRWDEQAQQLSLAVGNNTFLSAGGSVTGGVVTPFGLATNGLQFASSTNNSLTVAGQFRDYSVRDMAGQYAYDNATLRPPTITQHGTAGAVEYQYWIAADYPNGQTWSYVGQTFTGNATLSGTNYNVISCSVIPAGLTGTVYTLGNAGGRLYFGLVGTCSSSAASVNDTGAATDTGSGEASSFAGTLLFGGSLANGNGQGYCFSNQNLISTTLPGPVQCISMPTAGVFDFDTTTKGNKLGTLYAAAAFFNGSPVCTTATGCGAAGVASIDAQTGAFTFSGAGVTHTGNAYTFSGTGTGVGSFAVGSWPSWLTPTVTNPTTSPSLAVAASAIPNSALANPSTTVNGQTCALGGTCTIAAGVSTVFGRAGAVVAASGDYGVGQITGAAPLASPALTGTPTGPTASVGTNTTQLATTAFVLANGGGGGNTTSTSLATGTVPKASGANALVNSALDDGVTTANQLTYAGSAGIAAKSMHTTDTVNNTQITGTTGSGGDSTAVVNATAGSSTLAIVGGVWQESSNSGAYAPLATTIPPQPVTLTDGTTISYAEGGVLGGLGILTLAHTTTTRTLNVTGLAPGASFDLILKQDGTGVAGTFNLGSGCTWYVGGSSGFVAATTLTLTSTANAVNIASVRYGTANCYVNLR